MKENKLNKIDEESLKWRAEDDARTLIEYQKIFNDKKRFEKAKASLKEKMDDIESVIGKE